MNDNKSANGPDKPVVNLMDNRGSTDGTNEPETRINWGWLQPRDPSPVRTKSPSPVSTQSWTYEPLPPRPEDNPLIKIYHKSVASGFGHGVRSEDLFNAMKFETNKVNPRSFHRYIHYCHIDGASMTKSELQASQNVETWIFDCFTKVILDITPQLKLISEHLQRFDDNNSERKEYIEKVKWISETNQMAIDCHVRIWLRTEDMKRNIFSDNAMLLDDTTWWVKFKKAYNGENYLQTQSDIRFMIKKTMGHESNVFLYIIKWLKFLMMHS